MNLNKYQDFKYLEEMTEGGAPEASPEPEQEASEPEREAPKVVSIDEYNELKQQTESMRAKMNELLGEKKREQEERRKAQEEAAKKAGDYEQLYKSQQQKTEEYQQQLEQLQQTIAQKEEQAAALTVANQLADGASAELLATFIGNRVKYTQDGIKILDSQGQLTVNSLEDLASEFKNDPKFSALIRGSQSSGGGAIGNTGSSGAAPKVMSRSEFDKLDPVAKMKFSKSGGTLTD